MASEEIINRDLIEVMMVKNKYVAFALFVIFTLAFWNLSDYLYTAFVTKEAYHFTVSSDCALPAMVALVVGYLIFVRRNSD